GSYRELEKQGKHLPVVEVHCAYKAAARYDDVIVIRADVSELKRASFTFTYEIRRAADERLLCTGTTLHACIDRDGKPVRIPDEVAQAIERPAVGAPAAR
ncbi:MAG TPA: thioesterase family protein, partial [Myxococcaceae bacterium]|nr:thioesterase family protein [Myxococcaceae bacterium]